MNTDRNAIDTQRRAVLKARLAEARRRTDELFEVVQPEALYQRPIPDWHRMVFYLGHFETFDWGLACRDALGLKPADPALDELFTFGFQLPGQQRTDKPSDWPRLEEIRRYIRQKRAQVDAALEKLSFSAPPHPWFGNGAAFEFGIEHRLMHAETFVYKLHCLPYDRKIPPQRRLDMSAPEIARHLIEIPAGRATLGRSRKENGIGWDNEYEALEVEMPAFAIDSHNVTNADYLAFVRAGGYRERSFWTEADWEWVQRESIQHPPFWVARGEKWFQRTLFDEIPLPPAWPVYVTQAEASAYARWQGKALPTEAQFHRAAYGTPEGGERVYPWGDEPPSAARGNFDFQRWEPAPVGSHPAGASAFGVDDLVGNGWEWTATVHGPLPGFQPLAFYPTYSSYAFDGQHYVLKGGSARTGACLLRRSLRNWYQPRFPYVYATFRCVEG